MTEKHAGELAGKDVIGSQGSKLGRVKDIILDTSSWQVKALEVDLAPSVADELGLKRFLRKTQVQINVGDVTAVADTVLLKLSKPQLQALVSGPTSTDEAKTIEEAAK